MCIEKEESAEAMDNPLQIQDGVIGYQLLHGFVIGIVI
jgi:hypothetical protein